MSTKRMVPILWTVTVLLAIAGCNLPMSSTPEAFVTPTPNLTLTAIFNPPVVIPPTVTLSAPANATSTPAPTLTTAPTTAVLVPTATSTTAPATPTKTAVPVYSRSGTSVTAEFLSTAPKIDGDWSDWDTKAYPASSVVYGSSNWSNAEDLEASFRIGWNNSYLFVAVKVLDDKYIQQSSGATLYKGDSMEILLDTDVPTDYYYDVLSTDDYQIGISPGLSTVGKDMEAYLWYPSSKAGKPSGVEIAAIQSEGVWRVEAAIPWSVFGVTPSDGKHFGFALSVSDDDKEGEAVQQSMVSNISSRALTDPTTWGDLTLSK